MKDMTDREIEQIVEKNANTMNANLILLNTNMTRLMDSRDDYDPVLDLENSRAYKLL